MAWASVLVVAAGLLGALGVAVAVVCTVLAAVALVLAAVALVLAAMALVLLVASVLAMASMSTVMTVGVLGLGLLLRTVLAVAPVVAVVPVALVRGPLPVLARHRAHGDLERVRHREHLGDGRPGRLGGGQGGRGAGLGGQGGRGTGAAGQGHPEGELQEGFSVHGVRPFGHADAPPLGALQPPKFPMNPLDQTTRGRTAPERLHALDAYLCHAEPGLLRRADGPWEHAAFVDVGFGDSPATTLESARAFRALHPGLPVIGVELDAGRAEAAACHADARTHFRQGGFDLPLQPGETVRLLRAMNLLRQYPATSAPAIHQKLGEQLLAGGLLIEGSSDTAGGVLVAHLLRREAEGLSREALLFHTDFSHGFAPVLFRDWLPRDLRRRVHPGEPIHAFFQDWMGAWNDARAEGHREPRDSFRHSALRLASRREGIDTEDWLLEHGYLRFRPPGGVFR